MHELPSEDQPTIVTGRSPLLEAVPKGSQGRPKQEWLEGKFRLLEKLGEGGFGLVYKAEQTHPIQRMVAVKVLKAGMDTREVIARFETERQSLALMEHPNIARVLDAGETDQGQPYFVMELVRGRSITRYARERSLDLRARLELFIPVCHAVNHAHQKGIIHRDLKPSNVMVMEEDGHATPKVIDFGIAKVLEQKDASLTLATGMDQLVGTPGYISPEQIEHGSSHVDTRSDVYALGSILLELLTGRGLVTPMDLAHKPIHMILRDQVELDPPKPSSREPELRGDLDWITLKALERDPARRYGSADDLADDLRRFLNHEPVRARPPSRRYLLEKFVRRHRVGVAAAAAVAMAVLSGGVTSTALYLEAEKNRHLLVKAYSSSDEQMARQLTDRQDYPEAVAWLCRALRTDAENSLAATNLLSLLQHVHLLRPLTPELELPQAIQHARFTAYSAEENCLLALGAAPDDEARDVLCVWNVADLKRTDHPLPEHVRASGLLVTPDGSQAVLSRLDGQVELIRLPDAQRQALTPLVSGGAVCMALSGDGLTLAAGGEGGQLHVWDLRRPEAPAKVLTLPEAGSPPVLKVALDYLGTVAATASALPGNDTGGRAIVWDLLEEMPLGQAFETEHSVSALALNREQELLAVGLYSGVMHVGNFRAQTELLPPLVHPGSILGLSLTQDGSALHVGDGQGYLHGWDLRHARPLWPAEKHDGEILVTQQVPARGLLVAVSRHGELNVRDMRTGARTRLRLPGNIAEAALSAGGAHLATASVGTPSRAAHIQLWSIHERMTTRRWLAAADDPAHLPQGLPADAPPGVFEKKAPFARAHGGRWFLAGRAEGRVTVYDAQFRAHATLEHPPAVGALAISADGRLAVTSGRDQQVRFWDAQKGAPLGIALRFRSFVPVLALSPDASRLVTLTDEGELRVWDTASGESLTPPIRQGEGITAVKVSEDGTAMHFLVHGAGWFTLPMPPQPPPVLPAWFLDLAEALARRRLTEQGKTQSLTLAEVRAILSRIPAKPQPEEAQATLWAGWLLSTAQTRALSPGARESLASYLEALAREPHPEAQAEAERLRQ